MMPQHRAARAVAARALLADPTVIDALSAIENDLIGEWRRSFSTDERENIWRALNVMDRLRQYLTSYASHDLTALRRTK